MKAINLTDENLKDVQVLLNYLLNSEIKSYEEYCFNLMNDNHNIIFTKDFYNKSEIEHIYAYAKRVKDAIESSNM